MSDVDYDTVPVQTEYAFTAGDPDVGVRSRRRDRSSTPRVRRNIMILTHR